MSPKGIFFSGKNRIAPFFSNPLSPTSHPNGSAFVTVDAMSSTGLSLQCSPGSRPAVLAKSGQMSPPYIRSISMSPIYRRYGGVSCLCSRNQREVVSRNPHRRAKCHQGSYQLLQVSVGESQQRGVRTLKGVEKILRFRQ